jgi:hypothetical protein
MLMRLLRPSAKWWIFLPFAPVVLLLLLDATYEVLSYFRLYAAASVIDAVTIFVTVVPLGLHWAVSILLFGLSMRTPYPLQVVELVAAAALFSACLLVSDLAFTMAFHRLRRHDHI